MVEIPNNVKTLFEKTPLVAFATADNKGNPNVVPIFWKWIFKNGRILLIDNFMKMSKQNLKVNDSVCLSIWDPDTEEAYKIKGVAKYFTEGKAYEEGKKLLQAKKPERVPKGVIEIKVTEVYNIKPGNEAGKRIA